MIPTSQGQAAAVVLIAAVLGCAALAAAQSHVPSSPNYRLERYAFTGGRGNTEFPPDSTGYQIEACSLGGIADDVRDGASFVLDPGYLVPRLLTVGTPDILELRIAGGRVHLSWRAVPNAAGYYVETTTDLRTNFTPDAGGVVTGGRWDGPTPTLGCMFYRVVAIGEP